MWKPPSDDLNCLEMVGVVTPRPDGSRSMTTLTGAEVKVGQPYLYMCAISNFFDWDRQGFRFCITQALEDNALHTPWAATLFIAPEIIRARKSGADRTWTHSFTMPDIFARPNLVQTPGQPVEVRFGIIKVPAAHASGTTSGPDQPVPGLGAQRKYVVVP